VVVCSGGLDSTTVATIACRDCSEIVIMHFLYGCQAEERETKTILKIVGYLKEMFPGKNIRHEFVPMHQGLMGGSTLTDPQRFGEVAKGDTGVETHNEWVPARNLVFLSHAAAYCDRYRFGRIYFGTNLEESGAFPDNTTEFFDRISEALQVGTTSRPVVVNPLGDLMKSDIVRLGLSVRAPLHLSWSCYLGADEECFTRYLKKIIPLSGCCGPCLMKAIGFEVNGITAIEQYRHLYQA
jgi:7-cyano-7-deazaguanine synthase